MPTKKAKRRSKGPKCVICGKPATITVFWRVDGFSVVPIRAEKPRRRKAAGK